MGSSIFFKYPQGHDFGGKKVLNLGCGGAQYKVPNVVNLDAFDICNPDVVWDLNKTPLPFEDETFDLIIANHVFEHLPNWWECFEDCARVLKADGKLEIYVPGSGSDSQLGYRDHVSVITQQSFFGIYDCMRPSTNAWAAENVASYANRLVVSRYLVRLENEWWLKILPQFLKEWCAKHLRNVVFESGFVFRKMSNDEYLRRKARVWQKQ